MPWTCACQYDFWKLPEAFLSLFLRLEKQSFLLAPVEQIQRQRAHHVQQAHQQHHRLDHLVVPAHHGVKSQLADAGDVENGLRHRRAAQAGDEGQPHHREDADEGQYLFPW